MWSVGHARKLRVNLQSVQWTKTTTLTRGALDELARGQVAHSPQTTLSKVPSQTSSHISVTPNTTYRAPLSAHHTTLSSSSSLHAEKPDTPHIYPPPPPPPRLARHVAPPRSYTQRTTQPQQTTGDSSTPVKEQGRPTTRAASASGARTRRFQANTVEEYEAVIERARSSVEVDLLFREANARFGERFPTLRAAAQQQARLGSIGYGVQYLKSAKQSIKDEHFSLSFLRGCLQGAFLAKDVQSIRDVNDMITSIQAQRRKDAKAARRNSNENSDSTSRKANDNGQDDSAYHANSFKKYVRMITRARTAEEVDILFREVNTRYGRDIGSLRAAFRRMIVLKDNDGSMRMGVRYLQEASRQKGMKQFFTGTLLGDTLPVAVRRRDAESARDILECFPKNQVGMKELTGVVRVHRSDPKRGCEYVEWLLDTGELDAVAAHVSINVCTLAGNYDLGERVWKQTVKFDKRGDSVLNRAVYRARIKFLKDMGSVRPDLPLGQMITETYQHAADNGYSNIYEQDESFVDFRSELAPHIGKQKYWSKTTAYGGRTKAKPSQIPQSTSSGASSAAQESTSSPENLFGGHSEHARSSSPLRDTTSLHNIDRKRTSVHERSSRAEGTLRQSHVPGTDSSIPQAPAGSNISSSVGSATSKAEGSALSTHASSRDDADDHEAHRTSSANETSPRSRAEETHSSAVVLGAELGVRGAENRTESGRSQAVLVDEHPQFAMSSTTTSVTSTAQN